MLEQVLERIAVALEKQNALRERQQDPIYMAHAVLPSAEGEEVVTETTRLGEAEHTTTKRRRRTKAEIEAVEKQAAEQTPATAEFTKTNEWNVGPDVGKEIIPEPAAEEVAVEQQGEPVATATETDGSTQTQILAPASVQPEIASAEPTAPAVTWEDALTAIKAVNDAPNGGRQGVIKIMVQFGVTPADVDPRNNGKVPDLQRTGKFAEIKSFAESLLAQRDLGI